VFDPLTAASLTLSPRGTAEANGNGAMQTYLEELQMQPTKACPIGARPLVRARSGNAHAQRPRARTHMTLIR
jgi:hypothetical protein